MSELRVPAALVIEGVLVVTGRGALVLQTLLREGISSRVQLSPDERDVLHAVRSLASIVMQRYNGADFGARGTVAVLGADSLTVEETAARLGCRPRTVRKYATQLGGRKDRRGAWVFDPEEIAMEVARRQGVA